MLFNTKKPYEKLTTVGAMYEVTILEGVDGNQDVTSVITGELRGWEYDEAHGYTYAVVWEEGASKAEAHYVGDIIAVEPIDPLDGKNLFFTPYKDRNVAIGQQVDVYRNLHTNNGYSIRCSKSGLVLSHCSTVRLKNAKFVVSESGRQKTIQEKRKRVHAYVRGELAAYNEALPKGFEKVKYNPYYTSFFVTATTNQPINKAEEVYCGGKYAYAKQGCKYTEREEK